MPYVYRCNACRTRNTFLKPWRAYVWGRVCRHCQHTRFYVDKERTHRVPCRCGGYHYPHRLGGGACDHSPTRALHIAKRGGDKNEIFDAQFDLAAARSTVSTVCPF